MIYCNQLKIGNVFQLHPIRFKKLIIMVLVVVVSKISLGKILKLQYIQYNHSSTELSKN